MDVTETGGGAAKPKASAGIGLVKRLSFGRDKKKKEEPKPEPPQQPALETVSAAPGPAAAIIDDEAEDDEDAEFELDYDEYVVPIVDRAAGMEVNPVMLRTMQDTKKREREEKAAEALAAAKIRADEKTRRENEPTMMVAVDAVKAARQFQRGGGLARLKIGAATTSAADAARLGANQMEEIERFMDAERVADAHDRKERHTTVAGMDRDPVQHAAEHASDDLHQRKLAIKAARTARVGGHIIHQLHEHPEGEGGSSSAAPTAAPTAAEIAAGKHLGLHMPHLHAPTMPSIHVPMLLKRWKKRAAPAATPPEPPPPEPEPEGDGGFWFGGLSHRDPPAA